MTETRLEARSNLYPTPVNQHPPLTLYTAPLQIDAT
jgi:hypothetical protein